MLCAAVDEVRSTRPVDGGGMGELHERRWKTEEKHGGDILLEKISVVGRGVRAQGCGPLIGALEQLEGGRTARVALAAPRGRPIRSVAWVKAGAEWRQQETTVLSEKASQSGCTCCPLASCPRTKWGRCQSTMTRSK
jgi:hypothetical protein